MLLYRDESLANTETQQTDKSFGDLTSELTSRVLVCLFVLLWNIVEGDAHEGCELFIYLSCRAIKFNFVELASCSKLEMSPMRNFLLDVVRSSKCLFFRCGIRVLQTARQLPSYPLVYVAGTGPRSCVSLNSTPLELPEFSFFWSSVCCCESALGRQQFLYFLPLPQGHAVFLLTFKLGPLS